MASKLVIKPRRGLAADLPGSAAQGEFLVATDTGQMFLGNGVGNPLTELCVYGSVYESFFNDTPLFIEDDVNVAYLQGNVTVPAGVYTAEVGFDWSTANSSNTGMFSFFLDGAHILPGALALTPGSSGNSPQFQTISRDLALDGAHTLALAVKASTSTQDVTVHSALIRVIRVA